MKRGFLMAIAAGSAIFLADAAQAQWLGPYLDAQRWSNLREHQQRQSAKANTRNQAKTPATRSSRPLTMAERQAAWSRNKAEYRQRMLRDGQASADRWLDSVALASR